MKTLAVTLLTSFTSIGAWSEYSLKDLTETEYSSIHNETYWFIEETHTLEGFYVASVRSNLIWGDRMSVFVDQANCGLEQPQIFLQLTTNKVKTDYPNFVFSSLEGKTMRLNLLPENSYRQSPNVNVLIFKTESDFIAYTLYLNFETLSLDYIWKYTNEDMQRLNDNIENKATYFCKVI